MSGMRIWLPAGLLAAIIMGGCNAPQVQREQEVQRFEGAMAAQVERMRSEMTQPLTVERCVELALANSLDLRVKQMALAIQDDEVRLALSGAMPRASLAYVDTRRSNEASVQFGEISASFEDQHQQRLTIAGMLPILDWGVTYYAYKNAQDRRRQEELLLLRAMQVLRRDVEVAYVRHAGAIRQEKLAGVAAQAAQQVLRVARSLEKEAMAVRADTSLVEAASAQANLLHSLAIQNVQETHMVLAQLMSLPPGVDFTINSELPPLPPPPTAEQVAAYENSALRQRPELHVQDLERHITANSVRSEAAAFFPRLDGIGGYNWSNASIAANPSYFLYGFQVTHSLLDGGATLWRYSRARTEERVETMRTLLISLGVLYEVQLSALQVVQAHDTIASAAALEKANREALARVVSLYNEGLEDEAGAARALADLTTQTTVLDRAQTNYLVTWYTLKAAALPAEGPATQPTTQPATQPTAITAVKTAN